MQTSLIDAQDGGYWTAHVSFNRDTYEHACYIPEVGTCRVVKGPFAWHIVEVIEPPRTRKKEL